MDSLPVLATRDDVCVVSINGAFVLKSMFFASVNSPLLWWYGQLDIHHTKLEYLYSAISRSCESVKITQ